MVKFIEMFSIEMWMFIEKRTDKSIPQAASKDSQGQKNSSHWHPYRTDIALGHLSIPYKKFALSCLVLFIRVLL